MYCIFLCNIVTNPPLNLITITVGNLYGLKYHNFALLICEIAVVFIEAGIILRLCNLNKKKALLLSAVLNLTSFGVGSIVLKLFC